MAAPILIKKEHGYVLNCLQCYRETLTPLLNETINRARISVTQW